MELNSIRGGRVGFLAVLIAMLGVAGCGQGDSLPDYQGTLQLGEVTGRVTLNGEPVEGARVVFELSESRPLRTSSGTTDAEGRYEMFKERGVPGVMPGYNIVRVTGSTSELEDESGKSRRDRIPAKFNRKSRIVFKVEPLTSQEFDIPLVTK